MPFPWAIAAKAIPWTEMIAAAPTIARGARELWQRVKQRDDDAADAAVDTSDPVARIAALENSVSTLAQEAEVGTELVSRLAEQNEQLVAALEVQKKRTQWALFFALAALLGVFAVVLIG